MHSFLEQRPSRPNTGADIWRTRRSLTTPEQPRVTHEMTQESVRGDISVDGSMLTINLRRGGRGRGRPAPFDPIHHSLGRICQRRERERERETYKVRWI
jgi:hypothetical protein